MRTVTFSDSGVTKVLKERFISAWTNKRPDLEFKDGIHANWTGMDRFLNGEARNAVTCVFAAPDGTVLHAMPGSLNAAAFLKEAQFALGIYDRLYSEGVRRADANMRLFEEHQRASERPGFFGTVHLMLSQEFFTVDTMDLKFFDQLEPKPCRGCSMRK
jgi:hypothetical protein